MYDFYSCSIPTYSLTVPLSAKPSNLSGLEFDFSKSFKIKSNGAASLIHGHNFLLVLTTRCICHGLAVLGT